MQKRADYNDCMSLWEIKRADDKDNADDATISKDIGSEKDTQIFDQSYEQDAEKNELLNQQVQQTMQDIESNVEQYEAGISNIFESIQSYKDNIEDYYMNLESKYNNAVAELNQINA